MRFYFNEEKNICATEDDVVEYLHENTKWKREELRACRYYYGWYECEVSNTIKDKINA